MTSMSIFLKFPISTCQHKNYVTHAYKCIFPRESISHHGLIKILVERTLHREIRTWNSVVGEPTILVNLPRRVVVVANPQ
jgi:hypothetical protein